MSVKIDKGVPFVGNTSGRPPLPWAEMEVGDSFLLEKEPLKAAAYNTTVRSLCSRHSRELGRTFRARLVEGGVRVWRIA